MTTEGTYIERYQDGSIFMRCFKCFHNVFMGHHPPNKAYVGRVNDWHKTGYYFCNGGEEHLPFKVSTLG